MIDKYPNFLENIPAAGLFYYIQGSPGPFARATFNEMPV